MYDWKPSDKNFHGDQTSKGDLYKGMLLRKLSDQILDTNCHIIIRLQYIVVVKQPCKNNNNKLCNMFILFLLRFFFT